MADDMNEKTETSVLRRKAQMGQEQFKARAMTAARALRITLSKVAEDEMGLALAAIGLTEERCQAQTVLKALDDTTLLLLLESSGRGPGAALIDSPLAGALVQQLTMGRVSELRENQPLRKPTRTDAALVGPLLDSLFERAGPLPDTTTDMQLLSGLRFGADIANTRLLGMALEADEYAHFSITVDVSSGTRQGKIDLLLPIPNTKTEAPGEETEQVDTPATLEPLVMSLNAQLRVALCRMRMPFSQLADLAPGDTLPLPDGALDNAEILTVAGRKVANGKLGQIEGLRAVRLDVGGLPGQSPLGRATDNVPRAAEMRPLAGSDHAAEAHEDIAGPQDYAHYDLPELPGAADDTSADLPDLPGEESFDLPDLPELPELPDLPGEFEDFDDLPELPELPMAQRA